MSLQAIVGATVIDGTGAAPIHDAVVLVDGERVQYVARAADAAVPAAAEVVNARGRYVIPGLLDANVHLFAGLTIDLLLEFDDRYAELVEEAAQITLKAGVTTVFDTWGPLDALVEVRDRINRGEVAGSRMFVAGNIVGLGGPLSPDFAPADGLLEAATVARINGRWEQGVGADLLWLTPDGIRHRVREYIERSGVDFVKYAASGHALADMRFITFSEAAQRAIVEEGHDAGLTVQAHTTSPESLRMEIEAGADLLQHGDVTMREPMPEELVKTIVDRQLPVAALICTERYMEWVREPGHPVLLAMHDNTDRNDRRLIEAGARLLLTTDGFAWGPRVRNHPRWADYLAGVVDEPTQLGESHVRWLQGAVERGMSPMMALLAATRDIAQAYRKADEIGTLTPGKRADLVVLAGDPLADVRNYGRVEAVMKDGAFVDLDALPVRRVITVPDESEMDAPTAA